MKRFINTLRHIWSIEELRNKILITLGLIAVYRFGSYVVLPGIDTVGLQDYTDQAQEGLQGLINIFAGGAFARASIFALGIMPYISASIVIQLMGIAVPYFQKMQKDGESGRNKQNQITRLLTIAITFVQAVSYLINLKSQTPEAIVPESVMPYAVFMAVNVILLTTGTLFVMWLGEKITDRGIGNGISLIIMIGIIARLPQSMVQEVANRMSTEGAGLIVLLLELVILLFVILVTIMLVQGVRRVPVQYAKRVIGNKPQGGKRDFLPLKVNAAGVMPIIFAQALMFLPAAFAGLFENNETMSAVNVAFSDYMGWTYNITFAVMIVAFTYFYTAVTINPTQIADDLKRNGGFVPGVKPGKDTADLIDNIMSRITFPGSLFLAAVAIFPAIAMIFGVDAGFAYFFGGTSLLIMVGVILDTLQQIESHLLMKRYDGLLKSGRLKGRSTVGGAA
ncbi:MAG: preprotein translocase subunit SecY [Bacteroidetes bacterium]|jgi:preprotein translocase subunit SecY|nr:preprotein translocase subunit SecY [Bacteroidota bacterium]